MSTSTGAASLQDNDPVDPWYLDQYTDFTNALIALNILLIIVAPITIYRQRKNRVIAARVPYVVITEIICDFLVGLLYCFTQGNGAWLQEDQSDMNCAVGNLIYVSLSASIYIIILARITLFYRVAQSNTWTLTNDNYFERLIYYLGVLTGPKDFLRADFRVRLFRKRINSSTTLHSKISVTKSSNMQMSQPQISVSRIIKPDHPALFDEALSIEDNAEVVESHTSLNQWSISDYKVFVLEILQWFSKILIGSLFVGSICVLCMTFTSVERSAMIESLNSGTQKYGDQYQCGIQTYNIFEGVIQILWNMFHAGLIIMFVRTVGKDSLGMISELCWVQMMFCLLWTAIGIQGLYYNQQPVNASRVTQYGLIADVEAKMAARFLHGLITFLYPVIYSIAYKFQRHRLGKQLNIKTYQDIEAIWHSTAGKQAIQDICRKNFALEMALFLSETNDSNAIAAAAVAASGGVGPGPRESVALGLDISTADTITSNGFHAVPNYSTTVSMKTLIKLYHKYVESNSPFQLNFPGASVAQWKAAIVTNKPDINLVKEGREMVFKMLFDNYRHQLPRELMQTNGEV